jgi:hypothetical protein
MTKLTPEMYWKAAPHKWGAGQIHIIHEDGVRTLCGKELSACPGRRIPAIEYSCRACAKAVEAREQRIQREQEARVRQQEYQAQRAAADREWWRKYESYLQSPQWKRKRAAVLQRAAGRCEACYERKATEVHHSTYQHVFDEPLFDLHAICRECHERITFADRQRWTP